MLDGEKFLRELPVLHGKIEMPDYNGVCTGVYLICEKGMGFISIFCTNERKENAIFGYDVLRNKGTFLSLHQIEILKCKIGKEQDSELHFNKGVAFDDIHDVVERNKDNLKDKGIIAIKGTKIFYDVYADMVSMSIKMIISDWIEKCYIKCTQEKNKKIESLFNAIRWINKVGNSTNKGDNIIYCVMALEFCLYKEKGNTIVEDKLNEYGIKEQSLMKTLTQNISVKIKTEGLENADAQILEKLESDMNSYLASKLKEASFNSKLQRMVKRLDVPITEDEMKLIAFFRNKRNSMIHGKGMDEIKETSIKKMIGIVSRIITYKLQELLRGDD